MTSHSSGSGRIDYEMIDRPERVCDMCSLGFIPAIDEPVCSECVRKLFGSKAAHQTNHAGAKTEFANHYRHDDCPVEPGIKWDDEWTAACDDECPACGCAISPYRSEVTETAKEVP